MSHQVFTALDELDAAMNGLRDAVEGIAIRREFFRGTHRRLTTAVAAVSVEVADNAAAFSGTDPGKPINHGIGPHISR